MDHIVENCEAQQFATFLSVGHVGKFVLQVVDHVLIIFLVKICYVQTYSFTLSRYIELQHMKLEKRNL